MPHGMLPSAIGFTSATLTAWCDMPTAPVRRRSTTKAKRFSICPSAAITRALDSPIPPEENHIAIGSASNVDEENEWEKDLAPRWNIVEITPTAARAKRFANGLESGRHGLGAQNQNSVDRSQ